jgi:membrane protein required for colicin V production
MGSASLTAFDIGVIAVVALSGLLALARGAVREVLGLATWIGAVAVAFIAFVPVRPYVAPYISEPLLADLATVAIVFLAPLIAFKILASVVAGAVHAGGLGPVDRALGFFFGALRGALIVCAGYLVLTVFMLPERQPSWVREARLLPEVQRGAKLVAQMLPESARILGELIQPEPEPAPAAAPEPVSERGYTDAEVRQLDGIVPVR